MPKFFLGKEEILTKKESGRLGKRRKRWSWPSLGDKKRDPPKPTIIKRRTNNLFLSFFGRFLEKGTRIVGY